METSKSEINCAERDEAPAPVRKCTGKRSEAWKILTATDGTLETVQEALSDILRMTHETGQEALTDNSENRSGLRKR